MSFTNAGPVVVTVAVPGEDQFESAPCELKDIEIDVWPESAEPGALSLLGREHVSALDVVEAIALRAVVPEAISALAEALQALRSEGVMSEAVQRAQLAHDRLKAALSR